MYWGTTTTADICVAVRRPRSLSPPLSSLVQAHGLFSKSADCTSMIESSAPSRGEVGTQRCSTKGERLAEKLSCSTAKCEPASDGKCRNLVRIQWEVLCCFSVECELPALCLAEVVPSCSRAESILLLFLENSTQASGFKSTSSCPATTWSVDPKSPSATHPPLRKPSPSSPSVYLWGT